MRTTITLDDDIYRLVMRESEARHLSLGKVISNYVRKGATSEAKFLRKGALLVAELPEDSPAVGMETVKRLDHEQ